MGLATILPEVLAATSILCFGSVTVIGAETRPIRPCNGWYVRLSPRMRLLCSESVAVQLDLLARTLMVYGRLIPSSLPS